jgi:hypothetical protein
MNTARPHTIVDPSPSQCRPRRGGLTVVTIAASLLLPFASWARADVPPGLVYTPVPPCVLVRTAGSPAGKMAADETREFLARGATDLSAQGGTTSGCGVPDDAAVLSLSLRIANAEGAGQLKAWAIKRSLQRFWWTTPPGAPGSAFLRPSNCVRQAVRQISRSRP